MTSAEYGISPGSLVAESELPGHEAERLLSKVTGLDRVRLAMTTIIDGDSANEFRALAQRRRAGEPLQYIEGTAQFGPLELAIDSRALVPRPETEQLWELAVSAVGDRLPLVVVDLCTGSGNLALALKHRFAHATVIGTDISAPALELAAENELRTGLAVEWHRGDLFAALPRSIRGNVDLLVSNPPYVAESEVASLPADVRDHEPRDALVSGDRGDEVLERIAAGASEWLRQGGIVACEINERLATRAEALFKPYGGVVSADMAGRPRFVVGRMTAG